MFGPADITVKTKHVL